MDWTPRRMTRTELSTWYERTSPDGLYVARTAVSQLGDRTRHYALKRDAQGRLSILLGSKYRSLAGAMHACERDMRTSRRRQPA